MSVLDVRFIALQQTSAITFLWLNQAQAMCRLKNQMS